MTNKIHLLENTIQEYAWGSKSAIPDLIGVKSSDIPQAELWMGAHPKAPSMVIDESAKLPLDKYIETDPAEILGQTASKNYGGRLPFLFKVLAAEKPLSIQAHPNIEQAKEGFNRENGEGIPVDSPLRNYRDDNHKPEIICALTNFWAMNGFRNPKESLNLLEKIAGENLSIDLAAFKHKPDMRGLKTFFQSMLMMEDSRKQRVIDEVVKLAEKLKIEKPEYLWLLKLHAEYPNDIGILSPLILNIVELKPYEAMFLKAGDLHAYLHGVGIELMANSDNVLRGGLTPKHIDINELFKIVNFVEKKLDILNPETIAPAESVYKTPVMEFELSVLKITDTDTYYSARDRNIEIMICTDGNAQITDSTGDRTHIRKGASFVIPASIDQYTITGNATMFKATVPI